MESLRYLLYSILACYLGSFSYILYQILFYQQKRFIFIKIICYFSFIAYLIIKLKNKYSITPIFAYFIIYIAGMIIARKTFRTYLLNMSKEYTTHKITVLYKFYYLLILLITPPFFYLISCKIRQHKYYKKYPQDKKRTIYELF